MTNQNEYPPLRFFQPPKNCDLWPFYKGQSYLSTFTVSVIKKSTNFFKVLPTLQLL